MMDAALLAEARNLAPVIGQRVNLYLPSVLARGEAFALRVSVVGLDGLPVAGFAPALRFEGCVGVEGLPEACAVDPATGGGVVSGLRAVGPEVAVVRARVESPDPPGVAGIVASNPAWVFPEPPYRLYWGDLHVHTRFSNCSGWRCLDPEWCYQYAREVSCLDFAAPADHLRGIAAGAGRWERLQALARQYNDPGHFATLLAFESSHAQGFGGDNNVYYLDDDADYFWADRDDMRGTTPKVHLRELWRWLDDRGKPCFTAPHHTGRAHKYRAWDEDCHDPRREPVFEIYSSWGSSEMRQTKYPISGGNNDAPAYFVDALRAGARFGVIASSDDHATLPGSIHHFRLNPYNNPMQLGHAHKGLAAVRCAELTREALFASICRRGVYATTHSRTPLEVTIGEAAMGEAVPADRALRKEREIRVRFTPQGATAARVVLMRNGEELEARSLSGRELPDQVNDVVFTDTEPFDAIARRDAPFHPAPFAVYYVRIEDGNGAHQWSSPIWIDG